MPPPPGPSKHPDGQLCYNVPMHTIEPIRTQDDLAAAIALFRAYAASLGFDLGYQGFESEMAAMPGKYAPPAGLLLLARDEWGTAIGCVAMRSIGPGACEMKRLYVAPAGRGRGLGARLVDDIITAARNIGFRTMKLDTIDSMTAAVALYAKAGFRAAAPYNETPMPGALFFALDLQA